MAFRIVVSASALISQSFAICNSGEQCFVNEEEGVSTLQVQRELATNFSNADCTHFYTHDCGVPLAEAPNQIEDMRDAFVQCCIKNGNLHHDVCQPFMEQIFEGHGQPSNLLCSKLSVARKEHHRVVQLLQEKAHVDAHDTAVTRAELDKTVSQKLGFGHAHKNAACAENWDMRLRRANHVKNVHTCMHMCEFAPECEAISFNHDHGGSSGTCVMCGTPTMADRQEWTTYIKQRTTRESRARCHTDHDCDYPGCSIAGEGGWGFECLRKGMGKVCVNRNQHSLLCKEGKDNDMPVPGHWCLNHHLYRVCPQRP